MAGRPESGRVSGGFRYVLMTARSDSTFLVSNAKRGYPELSTFVDSSEHFMVYRRFGYLQSRVLLDKQDRLRLLEETLDEFDASNEDSAVSRLANDYTKDKIEERNQLLHEIDVVLLDYSK